MLKLYINSSLANVKVTLAAAATNLASSDGFKASFKRHYVILCLLERFSYDFEMKAREQNRNDKRTEIGRFDWFIERKDKRAWLFIG